MLKKILFILMIVLSLIVNCYAVETDKMINDLEVLVNQVIIEYERMEPLIDIWKEAEEHALKLQKINSDLDNLTAVRYGFYVEKYSRINNLDPDLVIAIIKVESHAKKDAVSHAGAYGLMQVRLKVWKKELNLISKEDLFDPEINIKSGCYILRYYLDRYDGDIMSVIMSYNTGSIRRINHNYTTKVINSYFNIKN